MRVPHGGAARIGLVVALVVHLLAAVVFLYVSMFAIAEGTPRLPYVMLWVTWLLIGGAIVLLYRRVRTGRWHPLASLGALAVPALDVAALLLLAAAATATATKAYCGSEERAVLAEFPQYEGQELNRLSGDIESQACVGNLVTRDRVADVLAYYRQQFVAHGWKVDIDDWSPVIVGGGEQLPDEVGPEELQRLKERFGENRSGELGANRGTARYELRYEAEPMLGGRTALTILVSVR